MNDGRRLRREDRQTVVDGSRQSTVSRDGEAGNFAQGEMGRKPILPSRTVERIPVLAVYVGCSTHENKK